MRKIFTFLIIMFIAIVNIDFSYSSNNNQDSKQISYLIDYINGKINDIGEISDKYNLNDDIDVQKRVQKLEEIRKILVKTKKTWEYNKYISKLIIELKNNNILIKKILKEKIIKQKDSAKKYSILYFQKIKPAIDKIESITTDIAKTLMKKDKLNSKDKQIVSILVQIRKKLDFLKELTNKNWNTKKEIKDYISTNFKQITSNFKQIKDIIKSTK